MSHRFVSRYFSRRSMAMIPHGTRRFIAVAGISAGLATGVVLAKKGTSGIPAPVLAASVPIHDGTGGTAAVAPPDSLADDGLASLLSAGTDRIAQVLASDDEIRGTLNRPGLSGVPPLVVAAFAGQNDAVRLLLDAGADVEAETHLVRSLPHWRKYFAGVQPLGPGLRALDFAIIAGHTETITLLVERGRSDPAAPRALGKNGKPHPTFQPDSNAGNSSAPTDVSLDMILERSIPVVKAAKQGFKEKRQAKATLEAAIEAGLEQRAERLRRHRLQFPLEAQLEEQLVGQHHAIQAVSSAVRRKENGWVDDDSPLVMLFMGSSGIGKTRTAKLVGEYLHGRDDKEKLSKCFIRVDMSEFQHKHEVSKFIGAPPGYVGFESGGQLVGKLEKCPNAVVLLDEVEKAHPDVLTVMLQAFDEGRLTDGQGKTVNCSDAVFVLTSNLAQQEIADEAVRLRSAAAAAGKEGFGEGRSASASGSFVDSAVDPLTKAFKRDVVQPVLRRHFRRDEFLGRINEILFFLPFTEEEQRQLAAKELGVWSKRARERLNIDLSWTPEVAAIAAEEYDLRYGARSIKYEIDRMCIAPIARAQEQGVVAPGSHVHIGVDWPSVTLMKDLAKKHDDSRAETPSDRTFSQAAAPSLPRSWDDAPAATPSATETSSTAAPPEGTPPQTIAGSTQYHSGKVVLSVVPKKDRGSGLKRFLGL